MDGVVIAGEPVPEPMIPALRPEYAAWRRQLRVQQFDGLEEAMRAAYDRLDSRIGQNIAQSGIRVACHQGCSWCCRGVKVEAHAPEALVIARRIESDPQLRSVLEAAATRRRNMNARAIAAAGDPCPFLDRHACRIYDIRPMTCRNHCCTDVTGCKRAFEHPEQDTRISLHMPAVAAASLSVMGMRWALESLALDARSFELTNAVAVALQEGAANEWLRGELVFDKAVRDVDTEDASIMATRSEKTSPDVRATRATWKSHSKKARRNPRPK